MTAAPIPAWIEGRLTPADKLEVHRLGLRHPAVSVFLFRDGRTLLQRRALTKYHTPGLWANACCTHPHWSEAPADCAKRRLREELGLAGLALRHRGQIEYRADVGDAMTEHELVDLFRAELPDDVTTRPNPDEVMDTRWIAPKQLEAEVAESPEKFTPWLRIYMARHAARILA